MQIIKPDNLGLLFTPVMTGDNCCISVAAMACFTLETDLPERLQPEAEIWQSAAAELGEGEAFDMGLPKQRGEFLVYGSCHAPQTAEGMQVSVTVSHISKTLNVTGPRSWNAAGLPPEPEPFKEMRVTWANAFGGEGWEPNPLGVGIAPGPDGRVPIPAITEPRHHLTSIKDRPEPAGFRAMNPFWPQRKHYLGAFDDKWLKSRWPHYPLDTDPEYFNTAPMDQRLTGFFTGDEPVRLLNMHPEKPEIRSTLPGVRARLFINRMVDGRESFIEISAHAETLWLFPGNDCGVLLFRGLSKVTDETMDDVTHLMAEWEPLNTQPESFEYYHRKFRESVSPASAEPEEPPPAVVPAGNAPTPQPETAVSAPKPPEPPPLSPEEEKLMAEMNAMTAKLEGEIDGIFAKMGMTREEAMARFVPKPAPEPSPVELDRMMADMEKQIESLFKKMGTTREEVTRKYLSQQAPPADPHAEIQKLTTALQQMQANLKKSGISQEELAKMVPGTDPAMFDFDAVIDGLAFLAAEIPTTPAPEEPKPTVEPPPEAKPEKPELAETIEDRIAGGKNLAGLDLTGMDFSGRDLSNSDFSGAILAEALFVSALLEGAIFTGALLPGADFSGATMAKSRLAGVSAVGAKFPMTDLKCADLSGSDFNGSDFSGADLSGATLSGSLFADASLRDIRGAGVEAVKSSFTSADLSGADLRRADLKTADFSHTNLTKTCFSEAEASQAAFYGAHGTGTDFSNAKMSGSLAEIGTEFIDALFSGADMTRSCWDSVRFTGVRMDRAVLDHADFSRSVFERAYMVNATAREADFMKIAMTRCDLQGVNFFKASFRHARLTECDLKQSSMFGTDLYKARIVESDTRGTVFTRAQAMPVG